MAEPATFDERGVEHAMLRWLADGEWEVYGLDDPEGAKVLDDRYGRAPDEPVYWDLLREKLIELNDGVTKRNVDDVITAIRRDFSSDQLVEGNRSVHELLQKGRSVNLAQPDGSTQPTVVDLIDHEEWGRNSFIAANQFRFRQHESVRPDVVCFVNGIPLIVAELKSLTQDTTIDDAIDDLHEYERDAPRLFMSVLFNIAADHEDCEYGAIRAPRKYYNPWKPGDDELNLEGFENEFKRTTYSLLHPETLLDVLKHFVFYKRESGENAKLVPRHMQYHGANAIFERVGEGDFENGLIWHTQGSGKSLTMLYVARGLLYREGVVHNPQVLILVDRQNLRDQFNDDLSALLNFEHYEVVTGGAERLQSLIEEGMSQVIVTTIQLFQNVDADVQSNPQTVVLSDEAHRFMEARLGSKLDAALDQYYHFGFTGTPVNESTESGRNTFDHFSPDSTDEQYLHLYSMQEGIEDDVILPVHFELRHDNREWVIDHDLMDEAAEAEWGDLSTEERDRLIRETINQQTLAELRPRVEEIAADIVTHFDDRLRPSGWKGMVVTPTRKAAALYGEELQKYLDPEEVEVVISSSGDDEPIIRKFGTSAGERGDIVDQFEDEENPKLLVVCDMLLTGFDAPVLKTIYLDRPLSNHTLLQAIARTNRTEEGKRNGEIIDYAGVFAAGNVDDALSYYEPSVRETAATDIKKLIDEYRETLDELLEIFEDIELSNDPETLTECIALLRKDPEARRTFKNGYKDVESLYDTIAPDRRLEKGDLPAKYQWVTQMYLAFRRKTDRDTSPEEDLRDKTRRIVEENIDIESFSEEFDVIEIGPEHIEHVESMPPDAAAAEIAHAATHHLQGRAETNPRYRKLSERVEDVIQRWQQGTLADSEAFDRLRALEREIIDVETEAHEQDLGQSGHALYAALVEDYAEFIEDDGEAQAIAQSVAEAFRERVDRSYPGWQTSPATRDEVQQLLLETVAVEHEKPQLCKRDEFLDDARFYLIENAAGG